MRQSHHAGWTARIDACVDSAECGPLQRFEVDAGLLAWVVPPGAHPRILVVYEPQHRVWATAIAFVALAAAIIVGIVSCTAAHRLRSPRAAGHKR